MPRNLVAIIFAAVFGLLVSAHAGFNLQPLPVQEGWVFPSPGAGRGTWDTSVGFFLGSDGSHFRNLQLRGDVDLLPGVRAHAVIRSDREFEGLGSVDPHFDEGYLEAFGFYRQPSGEFSASLRVGSVRYLRFPYPDAIAVFDQVPGVADLQTDGRQKTGYSGEVLTLDYAHHSGFGAHFTGIDWGFGRETGSNAIEAYGNFRRDIGQFHLETRVGRLAVRPEPLGKSEPGYNVYLGWLRKNWTAGVLYEKLHGQPAYTGIMVEFPSSRITRALGKVAFDLDRTPSGFSFQVPLLHGNIGNLRPTPPDGATLVGEVTAARIRTYWQNGQVRNYYEHRLTASGITTGKDLIVVMTTEPWYLQAEALVSPNTDFSNWEALKRWEKERQGPAQIMQRVIYRFYRTAPAQPLPPQF